MKYLILISGVLIFQFSCTKKNQNREQTFENIQKRLNLLNKPVELKYDTNGLFKLPKSKSGFMCTDSIVFIDIDSTETVVPPEIKDYWKYYSVIDLNNDGINDLIYSGPCDPYDQTGIFINDGKRLLLVYDYPGKIISLEKIGTRTIINSFTETPGCGYEFDNSLTEIIIEQNSPPIINRIKYLFLPKITFGNLKIVKVKGVLRWSPKQDDLDKKDECSNRMFKGNHLLQIDKETDVIKLTEQENWLLVLYNKNENESIIGWIKE